ncbi:MAG: extracellular solute-binding protein [Candidatus Hydrogenedentes bacterium]|nr:extracellular solute-binding protein [Candidatus Hydrogenedentota bacterium]
MNNNAAVFWDRQTTESAELLRTVAKEFNQEWTGLPIKVERSGTYGDIFRKITAGIHAKRLPALAVSYESMTNEYIPTGAVTPLDSLLADPEIGLSAKELSDYFPMMLETNRYATHDGTLYSFPFAKSLLMLYFNKRVLAHSGIEAPPKTWDEFIAQCRQVKKNTSNYAHAVSADCSTLNGMIFSMGGSVIEGRTTLYNTPEALAVFQIYETLFKEKLAYLISPGSYEDNIALSKGDIAFVLRSSSSLEDMKLLMQKDPDGWGLTCIPQRNPETPATVLYGPNICIFNTTEAQKRSAWAFVKHFTAPESAVRWSLKTGYLPVRKSVLTHPDMIAFWKKWPYNRAPFDCLTFARPEPNVAGWQQVRNLAARAVTEVMTGMRDATSSADELKHRADDALAQVADSSTLP